MQVYVICLIWIKYGQLLNSTVLISTAWTIVFYCVLPYTAYLLRIISAAEWLTASLIQ